MVELVLAPADAIFHVYRQRHNQRARQLRDFRDLQGCAEGARIILVAGYEATPAGEEYLRLHRKWIQARRIEEVHVSEAALWSTPPLRHHAQDMVQGAKNTAPDGKSAEYKGRIAGAIDRFYRRQAGDHARVDEIRENHQGGLFDGGGD